MRVRSRTYRTLTAVTMASVVVLAGCSKAPDDGLEGKYDNDVRSAYQYVQQAMPGVSVDLLAAAKTEGKVSFYTVTNPGNDAVLKAFREKFPFVSVDIVQLPGGPLTERYLAEQRAGQHLADVLQTTSRTTTMSLVKENLVGEYTPTSASALPADRVIAGKVYPYQASTIGVAFREDDLTKQQVDALSTWSALTRSDLWSGKKFGVLDVAAGGSTLLVNALFYKEYQDKVWKTLNGVGANIYGGTNPATEALLQEEIDIVAGASSSGFFSGREQGAPVAWTIPTPTLLLPTDVMLAPQAPHQNAAKLLLEFILSKDAQELYTQFGGVSLRTDFSPSGRPKVVEGAEWYKDPDMKNVYAITDDQLASIKDAVTKGWNAVFKK